MESKPIEVYLYTHSYMLHFIFYFQGEMTVYVDDNPLDCSDSTHWLFNPPPKVYVITSHFPCHHPVELRRKDAVEVANHLTAGKVYFAIHNYV